MASKASTFHPPEPTSRIANSASKNKNLKQSVVEAFVEPLWKPSSSLMGANFFYLVEPLWKPSSSLILIRKASTGSLVARFRVSSCGLTKDSNIP